MFEFVIVDIVVLVLVDESEDCFEAFLGLNIADLGTNQFNEVIEVDGLIFGFEAFDDVVDVGAFASLSKLLHDLVDFFGVDGA